MLKKKKWIKNKNSWIFTSALPHAVYYLTNLRAISSFFSATHCLQKLCGEAENFSFYEPNKRLFSNLKNIAEEFAKFFLPQIFDFKTVIGQKNIIIISLFILSVFGFIYLATFVYLQTAAIELCNCLNAATFLYRNTFLTNIHTY